MTTATQTPQRSSTAPDGWLFAASAVASFLLFAIPAYVIRPFRPQTPTALAVAMAISTYAPILTPICMLIALAFAVKIWRRTGWAARTLLIAALCLAAFGAVMSRIDYFEWMFHPIAAASYETPAQATLDASEMVMAVRFGDDARAYPIRAMAYHHILNEVVAGVPIVVTY